MTDDFYDPQNPDQDYHSCDGSKVNATTAVTEPPQKPSDSYIEPPNITTVWFRLPEFITDPSCNQLSASRFVLFLMGILTVFVSVWLTVTGQGGAVTGLITAVAATAAGVYFGSQFKDLRFKGWLNREERQ
jgi:hypothetical protein